MLATINPNITIPISKPKVWGSEAAHVLRAISSAHISGNTEEVRRFEGAFAQLIGRKYAVSAVNGTAALQLALLSLDLPPAGEVIVPAYSMMSPIFAALSSGFRVVPVGVDETWNIDPGAVEAAITSTTSAILVVHNYGHCADIHALERVASRHGIPIIEDAAEALGGAVAGRLAGTAGDVSCFSLYANKTITTGEGGILVTDSPVVYASAQHRRNLSFGSSPERVYEHTSVGTNYRLGALQAAFGIGQLEHAADAIRMKREIGLRYASALEGYAEFELQPTRPDAIHAYWAIAGTLAARLSLKRNLIQNLMLQSGVETRRFFSPVHRHAALSTHISLRASISDLPDLIYERGICLPSFVGMTADEVDAVCSALKKAINWVSDNHLGTCPC